LDPRPKNQDFFQREEAEPVFSYETKKGKKYYLRETRTKNGKTKVTISRSSDNALDEIPDGYEIYENINGQAFFRKIKPCSIQEQEISFVDAEIKGKSKKKYIIAKKGGDEIILYEPLGDIDSIAESMVRDGARKTLEGCRQYLLENAIYAGFFKFILVEPKDRMFQAQRFCYRGSVDDWINLDRPRSIKDLLNKFVVHFGRDSFYELC
jgi:hypothetical protein